MKITPSPFHSDEPVMVVTYVTPRAAEAGRLYFAVWNTIAPYSTLPKDCSPTSSVGIKGRRGGDHVVVRWVLRPEAALGDAFCPGPSRLNIVTQFAAPDGSARKGATFKTAHAVAEFRFRVFRPI